MFKNILLTVDLAHQEEQGPAIEAAKKHVTAGGNLLVVSVIPQIEGGGFVHSFLPENYDAELIKKGQEALHKFTHSQLSGLDNIKHLVVHGKVYEKVIDIAEQLDIDLIITMASIKRDRRSSSFGPNVARIVRNSNCSVLVLR